MKIWFCKSNDIGGWLIRLFTFSQWNHVAIEIDGIVWEAVTGGGVRAVPASSFPDMWDKSEAITVTVTNAAPAIEFLRNQLGKKYDWMALVALPFRTTWQSPHRWFCSELAAKALIHAGRPTNLPPHRVTPRDLFMALPEAGTNFSTNSAYYSGRQGIKNQ